MAQALLSACAHFVLVVAARRRWARSPRLRRLQLGRPFLARILKAPRRQSFSRSELLPTVQQSHSVSHQPLLRAKKISDAFFVRSPQLAFLWFRFDLCLHLLQSALRLVSRQSPGAGFHHPPTIQRRRRTSNPTGASSTDHVFVSLSSRAFLLFVHLSLSSPLYLVSKSVEVR